MLSEENLQARAALRVAKAQIKLGEGKPAEARAAAEEAFSLYGDIGWRHVIFKHALVEALEAGFVLGDVPGVESLLHEMERLRPVELTPYLQAQMARFAARLGVFGAGELGIEASFMAAEDKFRRLGVPFWLAVTQLEHGERLLADGRAAEARPLFEDARETFERLRRAHGSNDSFEPQAPEPRPFFSRRHSDLALRVRVPGAPMPIATRSRDRPGAREPSPRVAVTSLDHLRSVKFKHACDRIDRQCARLSSIRQDSTTWLMSSSERRWIGRLRSMNARSTRTRRARSSMISSLKFFRRLDLARTRSALPRCSRTLAPKMGASSVTSWDRRNRSAFSESSLQLR